MNDLYVVERLPVDLRTLFITKGTRVEEGSTQKGGTFLIEAYSTPRENVVSLNVSPHIFPGSAKQVLYLRSRSDLSEKLAQVGQTFPTEADLVHPTIGYPDADYRIPQGEDYSPSILFYMRLVDSSLVEKVSEEIFQLA